MGVTVKTFYEWQARFVEFREAIKRGKAPVDIEVENALLKRALGYEYEETTTEIIEQPDGTKRKHIKKTVKQVIPDTLAQIFWLKNRKPNQWREKREVVADVADNTFRNMQTIASLINNPEPDIDIEDASKPAEGSEGA